MNATCRNCQKQFTKEHRWQDVCSEECYDAIAQKQEVSIKCAIVGCRKRIRGRLGQGAGGGAFYSLKGEYLADLRNQEYRCSDHR